MAKRAEQSQPGEAAGHVAESGRSMGGERQVRTRPTALRVRGTSWGGENAAESEQIGPLRGSTRYVRLYPHAVMLAQRGC